MSASLWYVDVDFSADDRLADEVEFDVLEALEPFSPAMAVYSDRVRASLSMAVEAESALKAAGRAEEAVLALREHLGTLIISAMDVQSEEARESRNTEAHIPELVGFVEIAELAGVSRQRAREISLLPDFPIPVVETASGPLRVKAAVEKWLAKWERKPGRPRKLATV